MESNTAQRLLLLMTVMLTIAGETEGVITCTAVTTRVSTEVTCDFGLDINKTKQNFNIQFYYPDFTADPETPLMCNFARAGGLICQQDHDVIFNRVVSDQLRITRPAAVDKVWGQYVCHVVPSLDSMQVQPCNLTYEEIPTTLQVTVPAAHANDELLSYVKANMALTAVAVIFPLLIFLCCVVFLAILYRRRHRLRNWLTLPLGNMNPGHLQEFKDVQKPVDIPSPQEDSRSAGFNLRSSLKMPWGWKETKGDEGNAKDGKDRTSRKGQPRDRMQKPATSQPDRDGHQREGATSDQPLLRPTQEGMGAADNSDKVLDPRDEWIDVQSADEIEAQPEESLPLAKEAN